MSRQINDCFNSYLSERKAFVQTISELAKDPENIETLHKTGVMSLLRPLLDDKCDEIKQKATLALGNLASYSENLADEIISYDTLVQLVSFLNEDSVLKD